MFECVCVYGLTIFFFLSGSCGENLPVSDVVAADGLSHFTSAFGLVWTVDEPVFIFGRWARYSKFGGDMPRTLGSRAHAFFFMVLL